MKTWLKSILVVGSAALMAACGGGSDTVQRGTIAEEAGKAGFSSLVAAADKAGLVPALNSNTSSLTVFAPTNAAFASLATSLGFTSATAMVAALDGPTLAKILQYHVLPSAKFSGDLAAGGNKQATLYNFENAAVSLTLNTLPGVRITDAVLNEATVTQADLRASNGVIHAIDKVLVPPGVLNIVQMAQTNPNFSTLVGAVVSANLQSALSAAAPPLTVFAPTNAAFSAIASTVASLTTQQLTTVLTYHVLGSQVLASAIPAAPGNVSLQTLSNQSIRINGGTPPTITDSTGAQAHIVATDIRASNGVIHVIGTVLIPTL